MKHITGILLLFLFCISEMQPVWPYVEYALRFDYISKVLCINKDKPVMHCNGKCYLTQRIKQADEKDRTKSNKVPTEWEKIPAILDEGFFIVCFNRFSSIAQPSFITDSYFKKSAPTPLTPPPKEIFTGI